MVDLAKIRRKAAEEKAKKEAAKKEAKGEASAEAAPAKKQKGARAKPAKTRPAAHAKQQAAAAEPATAVKASAKEKLARFREEAGRIAARVASAQQAAAVAEPEDEAATAEILSFTIGGELYAIGIERIVEIINPRRPTPIPNAPAPIVGIVSLRGTIVTIIDVRAMLGHPPAGEPGPDTRIVVVEDERGVAGFVVDRVLRVLKVETEKIQPPPVVGAAEQSEAIRGVFAHGDQWFIVLDLGKLMGER